MTTPHMFHRLRRPVLGAVLLVGAACQAAGDGQHVPEDSSAVPASVASGPPASPATDSGPNTGGAARVSPDDARPKASGSSSGRGATNAAGTSPASSTDRARGLRQVRLGDIDLTGVGYDQGSTTAPVVIIDLSDFACPYCAEFSRETYPAIERDYVRTGKAFFKYVPFVVGSFRHSREATRAAECAAEQDQFWPMLDRVYAAQREWKQAADPQPVLVGLAKMVGVDSSRFAACVASGRTDARTARATSVADDIGVRVTPSFVVNGRPVEGALPLADFRRVIDAALLLSKTRR